MPGVLEMWSNHLSFGLVTMVRSLSCSPMAAWIFVSAHPHQLCGLFECTRAPDKEGYYPLLNTDNSKIIFLFLNENIYCDPSLEPSLRDGSNDGSQNMFSWCNMDNSP